MYRATALHFHTKSKQPAGVDWCSGVLYIDWCPGSCFISTGAVVRVLYRLVIWFVFLIGWCFGSCLYIDWYSGSCLTSIGDLVRVLYRLVLWFVCYFDCWCGPCFVWIGDLTRVVCTVHLCLCKWMLHWDDADVTLREAQKSPVKDGGAHVWKALDRGESGHDSLPLRGPTSNTHTQCSV